MFLSAPRGDNVDTLLAQLVVLKQLKSTNKLVNKSSAWVEATLNINHGKGAKVKSMKLNYKASFQTTWIYPQRGGKGYESVTDKMSVVDIAAMFESTSATSQEHPH